MDWVPRGRVLAVIAAMLLVSLAVAACGGGGSSSSSSEATESTEASGGGAAEEEGGAEEEKEGGEEASSGGAEEVAEKALAVAEEHKEVTEIGPTEPVGKPIPKGKKLVYINCGQPACTSQGEAFKEAAEVLSWSVEEIPAEPTPASIQAAFEEAIRRKPDGVASAGFGPALYPKQIKQLGEMNIPVFEATGEVGTGKDGVVYDPLGPETAAAAMGVLANKTVADIGGEGEVGAVILTGYPIVKAYTAGWTDEIEKICPECSVKSIELQPTSIGKDAPEKIASFVRANPDIKALYISYDLLASGLPAALKGAGITSEPLTYSWGVDAPGMEALANGERTASVPDPYNEVGWQQIDGFARIFTGGKPVEKFQEPIIWSEEFGNLPTKFEPFPAINPDYQAQFKKLWGVE